MTTKPIPGDGRASGGRPRPGKVGDGSWRRYLATVLNVIIILLILVAVLHFLAVLLFLVMQRGRV